jgi:hypothetical protein
LPRCSRLLGVSGSHSSSTTVTRAGLQGTTNSRLQPQQIHSIAGTVTTMCFGRRLLVQACHAAAGCWASQAATAVAPPSPGQACRARCKGVHSTLLQS